jgi:hypothetical protein
MTCHRDRRETNRISRFSRLEFPYMHRVSDSAASPHRLPKRDAACCLPPHPIRSAREKVDFGARWLACMFP